MNYDLSGPLWLGTVVTASLAVLACVLIVVF
jgi:hypothetical protein